MQANQNDDRLQVNTLQMRKQMRLYMVISSLTSKQSKLTSTRAELSIVVNGLVASDTVKEL